MNASGSAMESAAALPLIDLSGPDGTRAAVPPGPANGSAPTVSRLGAPLLRIRDASTFATRLRGLHAGPPLGPTDALLIRPCRAIQTYRMPCPIDVAFLDRRGKVLRVETVPPGTVRVCIGARVVLEMAAGTAARLSLSPGHALSLSTGGWT